MTLFSFMLSMRTEHLKKMIEIVTHLTEQQLQLRHIYQGQPRSNKDKKVKSRPRHVVQTNQTVTIEFLILASVVYFSKCFKLQMYYMLFWQYLLLALLI